MRGHRRRLPQENQSRSLTREKEGGYLILKFFRTFGLVTWAVAAAWAQGGYSGPAILSRNGQSPGRSNGDPLRFRVFGVMSGFYSTGMTPIATDKDGNAFDDKITGATAGFGGYGVHSGRRSTTGVNYSGAYQLYSRRNYYNGLNQNLTVNHEHQLSPKWAMGAGVAATQMSNVLGTQSRSPIIDSPFAPQFNPYNELFDNRLYTVSSQVGASYQHSPRLTFTMAGGTFLTTRQSRSLASSRGFSANGQITYALDRRTQTGVAYSYGTFYFPRGFGKTDINSWMGQFGRVLSRRWVASLGAGLYRAESQRVQTVQIDPAVAAIIGLGSSVQVAHNINNGLSIEAALSGRYGRAGLTFGYTRGIMPGNGVLLTSRQDLAYASASLTGTKRWNVGLFSSYGKLTQVFDGFTSGGQFASYGGGAGFNYRLFSIVHFNANADFRKVQLERNQASPLLARNRFIVSAGLAFSPGDMPLHIW